MEASGSMTRAADPLGVVSDPDSFLVVVGIDG
jgi:hypothetical protein